MSKSRPFPRPRESFVFAMSDYTQMNVSIWLMSPDRKKLAKPNPLELTFEPVDESGLQEPTFRIDREYAQQLMDALYASGMRPSPYREPFDRLERVQAELAEMRSLLFQIKISSMLEQCQLKQSNALEDQLDAAIKNHGVESDEAEAIRCRMDSVWKLLTKEQQNKVKGVQS
jgi:hypothetical protein